MLTLKNGNSKNCFKKWEFPIFYVKNSKNWEFPFFVLKMIEYFWNSHVFFFLATKKVLNFLGFPNEKCG